jgi:DNA-binding cell septation regulator SpoVG
MKVLKVQLRPEDGKPLRSFLDIELDGGDFVIRNFRIIRTRSGKLICLPPQVSIKKVGKEPYFSTLLIIRSGRMRRMIEDLAIEAYCAALNAQSKEGRDGRRKNAEAQNFN